MRYCNAPATADTKVPENNFFKTGYYFRENRFDQPFAQYKTYCTIAH